MDILDTNLEAQNIELGAQGIKLDHAMKTFSGQQHMSMPVSRILFMRLHWSDLLVPLINRVSGIKCGNRRSFSREFSSLIAVTTAAVSQRTIASSGIHDSSGVSRNTSYKSNVNEKSTVVPLIPLKCAIIYDLTI